MAEMRAQSKSILLATDGSVDIAVDRLANQLNHVCRHLRFETVTEVFDLGRNRLSKGETFRRIEQRTDRLLNVHSTIFIATAKRYDNNYFWESSGSVTIASFAGWAQLTRLPMANGLVGFLASLLAEQIAPGNRHDDNATCIYDFLSDKTGIDSRLRSGSVCRACSSFLAAKGAELLDRELQRFDCTARDGLEDLTSILDELAQSSQRDVGFGASMEQAVKWVLVTGAGLGLQPSERTAATRLGRLLARDGYGLISGTWGGVDEHVTRAFVDATLKSSSRIVHVENSPPHSNHQIRVGRVIRPSPDAGHSDEAVALASAGVIVSGRNGSKPTMDALMSAGKPVVPFAWLGNDSFESLQDLLREQSGLARTRKHLLLSLIDPACAVDETVSRVLGAVLKTELTIFISYHRNDCGADAGRLALHLAASYGSRRVFIDYESLEVSQHLETVIAKARSCRLLIVLVGPNFLTRVVDEHDYVRREVIAAHEANATILPILVDCAAEILAQLPAPLQFLALRLASPLLRHQWDVFTRPIEELANRVLEVSRMHTASHPE